MVQSRLVRSLLAPALRMWLRSQVESIESLAIDIEGGDRQILGGHIPGVSLQAKQAVYQGLHLSTLAMTASAIRINIGQVVRGQPLKLLAPIPVETTLFLDANGLEQSASAPLLRNALTELWQTLCQAAPELGYSASDHELPTLHCGDGYLEIRMGANGHNTDQATSEQPGIPLILRTTLTIIDGHLLEFRHPHLHSPHPESLTPVSGLEGFQLDLGRDVTIQSLNLTAKDIHCQGKILVMP